MTINVTVRSPQHKNGEVFDWTVQIGEINTETWIFKSKEHVSGSIGKHDIMFHNEETFAKHQVK